MISGNLKTKAPCTINDLLLRKVGKLNNKNT